MATAEGGLLKQDGELAEARRLAALAAFDILDTPPEPAFDDIVQLAACACATPIALVNLLAERRQWFKSALGLGVREMSLDHSICAVALRDPVVAEAGGLFIVPDLRRDPRLAGNPQTLGVDALRFYAGAPLISAEGEILGMLCVLDHVPRPEGLSAEQRFALGALARQVMSQMELRRTLRQRDAALAARAESERRGRHILDSAVDYAVLTTDPEGRITGWSEGARLVLGWTEAECLGQSVDFVFVGEDVVAGVPAVERAQAGRMGRSIADRWHVRRDGARFWATGETRALTDADGRVTGYLKILRDRTDWRRQEEALRAAQGQLRLALDAGGVIGTWNWDVPNGLVRVDAGLGALYGLSPAEAAAGVSAAAFRAAVHPDDLPEFLRQREEAQQVGGRLRQEYRVMAPGGARWIESIGRYETGPDGRIHRAAGVAIDIAGRKRAEAERESLVAALDAERDRLQALLDHLPVGVVFAEAPSGRVTLANPQVGRIIGQDVAAVPQMEAEGRWASFHADGRPLLAEDYPLRRALRDGVPTGAEEYLYRRADGSETWVELRAAPVLGRALTGGGRAVTGGVVSVVDIGEKKATERALRALNETLEARVAERTAQLATSEARFRALIEHAPEMIALVRAWPDGRLVYEVVNPALAAMAGRLPEGLVRRSVVNGLPPEVRAVLRSAFAACLDSGRLTRVELAMPLGGGGGGGGTGADGRRAIDCALVPMPGGGAAPGGQLVLVSARDITAQRSTEEALRQAQKMEAVGQLTGGIAHDFNNLLAGIGGSLELITKRIAQGRTAEIGRFAQAAMASAARAAALTHRLLAFSRRQTLDPRPTDVAGLVGGMYELIERSVGPAIVVNTAIGAGVWRALCDPHQLESALLNLAINARDAMPDGGGLLIAADNATVGAAAPPDGLRPGEYVVISVADTGSGMAPGVLARVFEPFYTTKPLGQGTGLGLSMVYGFAQQSGGQVRIESTEGKGTSVQVFLPRDRGGPARAEPAPPVVVAGTAPHATTVLVVDDEPVLRMLVVDVLEELGYGAIAAEDGAEALRILSTTASVDLLVSDVGLPGGINGRQLADAAQVIRPGLKVLFITGYADMAATDHAVLAPGMAVMTKPFGLDALAARIRAMVAP